MSEIVYSVCVCVTDLVVVIDKLKGESGVGELHCLQQGPVGGLSRLQCSLTPGYTHMHINFGHMTDVLCRKNKLFCKPNHIKRTYLQKAL